MGRGRQKAKHTKVARELKYFSPNTNYSQLERELAESGGHAPDYDAIAAKYADVDDDADDFEDDDLEDDEEDSDAVQTA